MLLFEWDTNHSLPGYHHFIAVRINLLPTAGKKNIFKILAQYVRSEIDADHNIYNVSCKLHWHLNYQIISCAIEIDAKKKLKGGYLLQ